MQNEYFYFNHIAQNTCRRLKKILSYGYCAFNESTQTCKKNSVGVSYRKRIVMMSHDIIWVACLAIYYSNIIIASTTKVKTHNEKTLHLLLRR